MTLRRLFTELARWRPLLFFKPRSRRLGRLTPLRPGCEGQRGRADSWRGGRRQTLLLAAAQALYLSSVAVVFTFSGLAGAELAPTPGLATLPLALITVVTAAATIPTSLLMARVGRRLGFQAGALIGATGSGVAAWGMAAGDFALFCLGNALMGVFQASACTIASPPPIWRGRLFVRRRWHGCWQAALRLR